MNRFQKSNIPSMALFIACIVALASTIVLYVDSELPSFSEMRSVGNNLGFFVLINLNLIAVLVLGFLVVKNIIKLTMDRKRNIFGARLRTRLVVAFVGLSLIPTVLLFLVAKGIVGSVMQGWFSPQIVESVNGAVDLGGYYYRAEEERVRRWSQYLSESLSGKLFIFGESLERNSAAAEQIGAYLDRKRQEYGLFEISIVDNVGNEIYRTRDLGLEPRVGDSSGPNLASVHEASKGTLVVKPEQSLTAEFFRGYSPLQNGLAEGFLTAQNGQLDSTIGENRSYVLVTTLWIPSEISEVLSSVVDAYDDYRELHTYRRPLVSSYILTLVVVTLLIVFSAIWVGFYLARSLSGPIQQLAEGTQQIAHGNLEYRIPEIGDDELSVLVRSFNTMTQDLMHTTGELVERRHYMETVLASVGVGVVSVDSKMNIATCNIAAADMLVLSSPSAMIGKPLAEAMPVALNKSVDELAEILTQGSERILSSNVTAEISGSVKHLHLTITRLVSSENIPFGYVVLIDDISELVSAQRMAAWREVARRIAHEIKNPLTPIQLSAQRLQRRFTQRKDAGFLGNVLLKDSDIEIIHDGTAVIIKQVENLRSLVNEFSQFARMPKLNPSPADINALIAETVHIYQEAHPEINFKVIADSNVPVFAFDREQLGRALMNLIDNAIASVVSSVETAASQIKGCVAIESAYSDAVGLVSLNVSDNGVGISEPDKARLFEPYFSTKKGGTGLGLAIVSSIVADHNGFIRVKDNMPQGVVFVIELPIARKDLQQAG